MKKIVVILFLFSLMCCTSDETVDLELPSIINSGMVLQRNSEAVIWGRSTPGKKVKITTDWGQKSSVRADSTGEWKTSLSTGEAGGPYEMVIQSGDSIISLHNILIGEVWLCSGQSNMEMPLCGWPPTDSIMNWKSEVAAAHFPEIRLFTVAKNIYTEPLSNCQGLWTECTPESVNDFSATAFYFGKEIYRELNVPVGLIHSSWGGTPAESWTSKEYLSELPAYKEIVDSLNEAQVEYDSLLEWMSGLERYLINSANKMFYAELDCKDEYFSAPDLDDISWLEIPVPSFWELTVLPDFDGIVWLRTTIEVPQSLVITESVLQLGPIDDMDIVYVNGKKIGETLELGKWKEDRAYQIPPGVLKEGENTLAICVLDNTGGGGLYSIEDLKIHDNKGSAVKLNGDWRYLPLAQILGDMIYFFDNENAYSSQPKPEMSINNHTPSTLFNTMINPLVPFTIKGAIWYQGETNVGRGYEYRTLFPTMIESWRSVWGQGDFPFYYVQIAPWDYGDKELSPAAELREAQLLTMNVGNTGMVVTTDIGNPENIHPANKLDVGRRLALWALAKDYGYDSIVYSGPIYDSLSVSGDKASVHFDFTDGGLLVVGNELTHFEVAGSDQIFHPAIARLKGNTVETWSESVTEPIAVRFGWSATAEPNLFNGAGLPASPFRTDDWKRLSE